MRRVAVSLAMFLAWLPGAWAQGLPTCQVGLRVERAGALNYPATIVARNDATGAWQVRFDGGSLEWLTPQQIQRGCVTPTNQATRQIAPQFFVGNWELFVGPAPQYVVIGGQRYLEVGPGAHAPPLAIKGDGTYAWAIDRGKLVNGRWRPMSAAEMKYGYKDKTGIMLMQGYEGRDWQATYVGVRPADGRDQIDVQRMDLGVSFLGTRMRGER